MTVFVLWEDKPLGPLTRFGPHVFLIACVASRLGVGRYTLARSERIDGKPCGGNANLLRELRRPPLWGAARHVVAVLDTDELHDRLPEVPSRRTIGDDAYGPWSEAAVAAVRKQAPTEAHAQLEVCFLDRNLETLLAIVGDGARELADALGKSRLDRDKILQRAAGNDGLVARACAEMPSWDNLLAMVARCVRG
jgi:hypothetical protein